ncbi:tryptophan--tRNA ligase [Sporomusa termitida]|uniref:Tryptophan--tRNA ligase n=1 Tax=Sporomusa termitida TaxID=2377 RepID=A0A517DY37_9FIRM|nr:tryptophan--tRNA ligase [Sporomusa termitida]QDR82265.1 Tryptophan--tRNA ligase 2 [Sporomusa termitida]
MQENYNQYILIADMQALTDNAEKPEKVSQNVLEVATDYLAVGIDPEKSKFVVQSQLPDIALLSMIFSNLISVARVGRNPTVKEELNQKWIKHDVPLGFFSYPVSQAADIAAFKASIVPVGQDQLPMIELTNEIVKKFNRIYGREVFVEATAIVPKIGRLPGIDGKAKMSKSLGNVINLKAEPKEIEKAVKMMFADPHHIHIEDPGKVEGNVVFAYLDVFDPEKEKLEELKANYVRGGLGDGVVKNRLNGILQEVIAPIRAERKRLERDPGEVIRVVQEGTLKAKEVVRATLQEVKSVIGIDYNSIWSKSRDRKRR